MRLALIIYRIAKWAVLGLIAALLIGALYSCSTQQKIVPVPEIHEQHHWHTDSVHQTDSIIRETQTTIMQLDSVAMEQYGITLKNAERAWLVKSKELERQIQQLQEAKLNLADEIIGGEQVSFAALSRDELLALIQ